MTFGHCGIDWMHSLLDSHPQILIMPALSFYRCWKMLNAGSAKNVQDMYYLWHKYINMYVGPEIKNEQKRFLHSPQEMERFFPKFYELLESGGISKIHVFWAIHEAYAYTKQIDLKKIKVIVAHEHLPWPFEQILSDFTQSKILMMMRDPRAAIAGLFHGRTKHIGYLSDYTFNISMEVWFQGQDMWKKHCYQLGKRYKIVKNEDLHADLEKHMRDIAKWLGVDFFEGMLFSTFPSGKPCLPDSLYLEKGKSVQPDDTYYLPDNVRKRWMNELKDPREILMIEFLFKDIMKEFEYDRITKDTRISRIKGLVYYLLPHRGLFKKWLKLYPDIEEFDRIEKRLERSNIKIMLRIWKLLPKQIKFASIIAHSILRRINIYFFPIERWQRYDLPNQIF